MGSQSLHCKREDEHILPLINIVFLLLIFFMVAGRLTASDSFRVTPPRSTSRTPGDAQALILSIEQDGQLAINGTAVAHEAVGAAVARRLADDTAAAPVRLEADAAAEAMTVVKVMVALREAGVTDLQLLTLVEER